MKIKFNWGTGIVIAFIVMVSAMLFLVSIALRQNDDLVEDDYYQKSINYQQHIDHAQNNAQLVEKIKTDYQNASLILTYPKLTDYQNYSGEIHFYSPVEAKRDVKIEIQADSNYTQMIDLSSLQKGRYTIKIDWKAGNTSYYQQDELTVE